VIDDLVEADYLLRLDPEDSTITGDMELVFKHNLERELIAKSTEPKKLARYHRLAAQWLETKLTARSEEQLEFLAQLYERGGEAPTARRSSSTARRWPSGARSATGARSRCRSPTSAACTTTPARSRPRAASSARRWISAATSTICRAWCSRCATSAASTPPT